MNRVSWTLGAFLILFTSCEEKVKKKDRDMEVEKPLVYKEPFRPQFHFSPQEKWMNDPNGLVYHSGTYHLFYQYYPDDIVWGPMHWGHAVSRDMIYWEHRPIALFPDENGFIFSGSAVVDHDNTSGFGTLENPPLVAIFTYHDPDGEKAGKDNFQTQGIAYSLDNGDSWTKYPGNPVIGNKGIRDFRDPKVFWNALGQCWTMLLAVGDHLQIWSSPNLKDWEKVSEFGKHQGAHGGVWECPDLFPLTVEGSDVQKWVLLISINPGAPNGGSGTQYFIGDFDGRTFTSDQKEHKWLDWGTDNYAGVTYNNVPGDERIFIGWMSNWAYARETPSSSWRSAMTLPRKLSLRKIGNALALINYPLENLGGILEKGSTRDLALEAGERERIPLEGFNQTEIQFTTAARDFTLALANEQGERFVLRMDSGEAVFSLDRTASGKVDFNPNFGKSVQRMPISDLPEGELEIRLFMDWSSVEVFINKGQYVMTAQLFPEEPYTLLEFQNKASRPSKIRGLQINPIKSIW
ncbi:MAG: glycoside hydrolase family 32 protein [Bacteroidota bacterium]